MSIISITVEDDSEKVHFNVNRPYTLLWQLIELAPAQYLIKDVSAYDDTVFNNAQIRRMRTELELLIGRISDKESEIFKLNELIIDFCKFCEREGVFTYLKFYGD